MDCVIPPLCGGGSVSLDMLPRRAAEIARRTVGVLGLNRSETMAEVERVAGNAIRRAKTAIAPEARQTVRNAMTGIGDHVRTIVEATGLKDPKRQAVTGIGDHVRTIVEATGLKDPKRQAVFVAGLREHGAEFLGALGLDNPERITEVAALTHNPVTAKLLELCLKMAAGIATGAEKGTYISSILAQLGQIPFLFSNFMKPAAAGMSKAI